MSSLSLEDDSSQSTLNAVHAMSVEEQVTQGSINELHPTLVNPSHSLDVLHSAVCSVMETQSSQEFSNNVVALDGELVSHEICNPSVDINNSSNHFEIIDNREDDNSEMVMLMSQPDLEEEHCFILPQEMIDETWTKKKLFHLVGSCLTREVWTDVDSHSDLFHQLLMELDMPPNFSWIDIRDKFLELYNCQATVDKNADFVPVDILQDENIQEDNSQNDEEWMSDSAFKGKRKSPDFKWSVLVTREFIRLRSERHAQVNKKGHNAIYKEILDELGISDKVTVMMARKKWNYLIKRYQDECSTGGERSWAFFPDMAKVMTLMKEAQVDRLRSRASPEFLWPNELTLEFIELKVLKQTSQSPGMGNIYSEILNELGIDHILTPTHLRKKWNYLVAKHKELSSSLVRNHQWPFYEAMSAALQKLPKADNLSASHLNSDCKGGIKGQAVWTHELLCQFISLRGQKAKEKNPSLQHIFSEIISELNISHLLDANQARRKWNYLVSKFNELNRPLVTEFARKQWPYYDLMKGVCSDLPESIYLNVTHQREVSESSVIEISSSTKKYSIHHTCYLCNFTGSEVTDFFMFEQDQMLLHTQRTVTAVLSVLLGKRMINMEGTTILCSNCTSLVNEADSVLYKQEQIKTMAKNLYNQAKKQRINGHNNLLNDELLNSCEITIDEMKNTDCREIKQEKEEPVSYSQRGRKRKATVYTNAIKKIEVQSDEEFSELFDDYKLRKKRKRKSNPTIRSTLIGKGLNRKYNNKVSGDKVVRTGFKRFTCNECEDVHFTRYYDLLAHKKESHTLVDSTPLQLDETVLESGLITYFNKEKANSLSMSHPCKDCEKVFLRKDDLLYHIEMSHTDGKGKSKSAFKDRTYSCEECGDTFLFKYKLKLHINNKHLNDAGKSSDDFTCGECGCKLGSLPGLTFHMRKHHNKVLGLKKSSEYLCSDCGYLATSLKKLRDHQKAQCGSTSKQKVQCEVCGKTVLKVSLKMHHIKMHSDFKEQCKDCGERYATKTDLLRHINVVHLNILLYACKLCEEKFPTSDALRYHKVKMHEKPSFFCSLCSKSYKRVGELNTHMKRAHNDSRKVEACRYCGKEYFDRSGLRNHLISKHNVPQELTYTENYLRKKRIGGLPLSHQVDKNLHQHAEKVTMMHGMTISDSSGLISGDVLQESDFTAQQLMTETVEAAEALERFNNASAIEGQSVIVTEIPDNEVHLQQHSQSIVIDQLGNILPQNISLQNNQQIVTTTHQLIEGHAVRDESGTSTVIYHQLAPAASEHHITEM